MPEVIYGRNPVRECLRAGRRHVSRLIVAQRAQETDALIEIVALAERQHVAAQRVERQHLDHLLPGSNHQGVAAEASQYPYVLVSEILATANQRGEAPWLLLLDCLQDPQNLGTLLRTAEVVGLHGVIIPERRSAEVTPAVVSASAGASEHLLVARVTNLVRTMEELKEEDVWVIGLEDVPEARPLWEADLGGSLALVVGSEGRGMRRLVKEACDWIVRLPMRGQVGSLNAAVAGSIALYEIARRRWT